MDAVAPLLPPSCPLAGVECPACGSRQRLRLVEFEGVPVHCNRLWPTREEALAAPRGDLHLVGCAACGHLVNAAFEPQRMAYCGSYENSLHFSPHFQRYARALAEYLVERFALRRQRIVEIGCGKGEFLALLCELGENAGIGFDPSWRPGRGEVPAGLRFVSTSFDPARAARLDPDFVCCRQVLEHLPDPAGFLAELRKSFGDRPVPVFFEVPNALQTIAGGGIWDLIYEHPHHFTPDSLFQVFRRAGFRPLAVRDAFAGQYLWLEAVADGEPAAGRQPGNLPDLNGFAGAAAAKIESWRQRLTELDRRGVRTVVWGAGSKGVTFLNLAGGDAVAGAVDLNPHKQGKFLPGTGQRVMAPEALSELAPGLVLVMNPVYREEIAGHLDRLGLRPTIETV